MRSVLDKSGVGEAKTVVTPGSQEAATVAATTAADGKDETKVSSSEHHGNRCMAGLCQYMSEMRY